MGDFPIIWLLVNTKTGRVILGLFIVGILVALFGWWLVPIVAGLIGLVIIGSYFDEKKYIKKNGIRNKTELVWAACFLAFAGLFALGLHLYENREWPFYDNSYYERPVKVWERKEVSSDVPDNNVNHQVEKALPDTAAVDEPPTTRQKHRHQSSYSRSYYEYEEDEEEEDGMRGFDPASEDDMDDNGMDRYMDDYDDEGWD